MIGRKSIAAISSEPEGVAVSKQPSNPISSLNELLKEPIRIGHTDVRNKIVHVLQTQFKDHSFIKRFVQHLNKMGRYKLDIYTDIEFILEEYKLTFKFYTPIMKKNGITYTINNLDSDVDPMMKGKGIFGWF